MILPRDLVGSNADDAESVLRGLGLEVGRTLQESEEVEEGFVISVSPPEGSTVPAGSTVTLVVSAGPPDEPPPESPTESPPGQANGQDNGGQAQSHGNEDKKEKDKGD